MDAGVKSAFAGEAAGARIEGAGMAGLAGLGGVAGRGENGDSGSGLNNLANKSLGGGVRIPNDRRLGGTMMVMSINKLDQMN